jgi:hypothetical protein
LLNKEPSQEKNVNKFKTIIIILKLHIHFLAEWLARYIFAAETIDVQQLLKTSPHVP